MSRRRIAQMWATLLSLSLASSAVAHDLNLEDLVTEHTLDNGLRLLMVERHEVPRVVCHLYFGVGSAYERPGITGLSHYLEHMMFKGTRTMGVTDFKKDDALNRRIDALMQEIYAEKYRSKEPDTKKIASLESEVDKLIDEEKKYIIKDDLWEFYMKNGGTGLNASTSLEVTGYYVTLPSNKVELQMMMESDRMANPYFREFYSEKEVVREERRLGENRPGFFFNEQLNATFYAASPYSWHIIGWDVDLQKVTREDMINYSKKYYIPNNAVAVYVGDLNPNEIIAMAKKYFGPIPRGPDPEPVRTTEPKQYCEKRVYGEADTAPEVKIMYHIPPVGHPDCEVFDVITGILNGRTGRLHKKLIKEMDIAVSASGNWYNMLSAGQFVLKGNPKESAGVTPEDLEKALYTEMERLKNETVSDYEIKKVKNQAEAHFIRGLRSTPNMARKLGTNELRLGWRDIPASLERMKRVTASDVTRVANTYFVKNNRTVGLLKRAKTDKMANGGGAAGKTAPESAGRLKK